MQHHQSNRHRRRHRSSQPVIMLQPGQAAFRIVCHSSIIGGVIGHSGKIISQIRQDSGCIVHCEEPSNGAEHRVIVIVGPPSSGRKFVIEADEKEEEEKELVSAAQEAVIRVCERMWVADSESKSKNRRVIRSEGYCGLLADTTQIGAVLGAGWKNVTRMRRESGADIMILPAPPCAAKDDKLIQITGDIIAVKRALVAITECLHDCPPYNKDHFLLARPVQTASYMPSSDPHAEFFPHLSPLLPPLTGKKPCSKAVSSGGDVDLNQDMKSMQQEVSFRLLCSNGAAGSIIGQQGSVVRTLQNETGASITFAAPTTGFGERIVTITAFENLKTWHSPAQNAIVLVFARSIEYDIEKRHSSDLIKDTTVTARLLVPSDVVCCLNGNNAEVDSEISEASGAKLQILGGKVSDVSSENDVVVEITGEYISVQKALFLVTGKLRDSLLPSEVLNEVRARKPRGVMDFASIRMQLPSDLSLESDRETSLTSGVDQLRLPSSLDDTSEPGVQALDVAASLPSDLAFHMPSSHPLREFFPHLSPVLPPLTGNTPYSSALSSDGGVGSNQDMKCIQQDVSFRLLCSNGAAGSIIGHRGSIVRALQNETGASITFAVPKTVSGERIVTITAFENLETLCSPAQNATVLVFARSIEHDIEKRHSLGVSQGTARLLVASDVVCCLNRNNIGVDSEITEASGAKIQILGEQLLDSSLENDVVVEITGEYINVQNALLLVTGKLRDSLLPSEVLNEVRARNPRGVMEIASTRMQSPSVLSLDLDRQTRLRRYPSRGANKSTFPGSYSSSGLAFDAPKKSTYTRRNNRPKFSKIGHPSPALFMRQTAGRGPIDFEASLEPESLHSRKKSPIIAKTTIELIIPENMLGSVCGEDGSNLTRLRQISGANVEVRDPSSSKNERVVIISGTPHETSVAQSLFQAFILADQ